jgi:competence ComEA-like helix-hairpin-helix protein
MSTPVPGPNQLPAHVQPLLAAMTACGLVAMACWFVASGGLRGGLVHHDAPPVPAVAFTVNVNAASATELAVLPGLGPAMAERIVEHRRTHGPFTTLDDLLHVPGIGPATLASVRPHLRPIRRRTAPPEPATVAP